MSGELSIINWDANGSHLACFTIILALYIYHTHNYISHLDTEVFRGFLVPTYVIIKGGWVGCISEGFGSFVSIRLMTY